MRRPCRAPTMPLWKGHLSAKAGERRGHSRCVWINIGRLSMAFGRPSQVRLPPIIRRTFSRVVFQSAATFGMCLIVLMTMETADYTEYELTLKIKSVFLLLLCYVSIVSSSFHCMWATTLQSFSNFETPIPKYLKNFAYYLWDFQRECEFLLRLLLPKTHYESSIFVFLLSFLLLKEGKAHMQLITSFSQLYMLTTVKIGGRRIQNRIR